MRDFYQILEIEQSASEEAIKQAYFDLLRKVHPDKSSETADPELVSQAQIVYNTLKNPKSRTHYDNWLREQHLRAQKGTVVERLEIIDEEDIEEQCRCGDFFQVTPEEIKQIVDIGIFECGSCSLCLEVVKFLDMSSTKIVVLGDTGVGKTSFCNAVAGKTVTNAPGTIGASICMAWHEYRIGTAEQRSELIELWDIGGTASHRNAAQVLLEGAAGVILVHDLSNKKSEENLGQWLSMIDGKSRPQNTSRSLVADIESCHIPVLTVGCKMDLAPDRTPQANDRINVDSRKPIPPGFTPSMALARFFDATIDRTKAPMFDRRKRIGHPL